MPYIYIPYEDLVGRAGDTLKAVRGLVGGI